MEATDRAEWVRLAERLARPVLTAIAAEKLRATMPVEWDGTHPIPREYVTHLEAVARLLAGIAPWLESGDDEPVRREMADLAQRALAVGTDPASPDYLNFSEHRQPLVDAAFLAHAIVRAPNLLWAQLDARAQRNLVAAMRLTRAIKPSFNNWLLVPAMVEAFFALVGEPWDAMRVDYAVRQHHQWYKGDGAYGDGPYFHWDYYNSFVIQPMLLDVLGVCGSYFDEWSSLCDVMTRRAQRYGTVLERLIAPDGSFPVIGRSLTYRCGAFQLLAQLALQHKLPSELPPAQVRTALSAVIARTLNAPSTFDDGGWLLIGLCGHQLGLAEQYISTGSLYLCSTALLPLGLPSSDAFWSEAPLPYTSQRVWSGEDIPADHALLHDE